MVKENGNEHRIIIPAQRYLSILFMLVSGISLSIVMFLIIHNWEKTNQRQHFEYMAKNYTNAVEITLDKYVEAVHFIGDYFDNSEFVTRQEFTGVIKSILPRYPGVQTFGWNPLVKDDERSTYESAARKDGYDHFEFRELSETDTLIRAARREEYVVAVYVYPLEGNWAALGFDIASNKTRQNAITKAFKTGKISATDRITLVHETGSQFGILLLQPIYHGNGPLNTTEERYNNRKGFVVEVLRIGQAVETALTDFFDEGISLTLYDLSADEGNQFLYHRPSQISKTTDQPILVEELHKGLFWSKTINFAERQWQILLKPSEVYYQSHKLWQGWFVLTGLLLLTILLAFYMLRKIQHTAEIERRVEKQTQTNQQLEKEIRERKQIEEKFLQAHKMEAIGTLAGGVAHDLNNILSGIVSYPDLLLHKLPDDSPYRRPILTIQESGKKAAEIVQDLLTLARRGIAVTTVTNLNTLISKYLSSPEFMKLKNLHPLVEINEDLAADLFNITGSPVHLNKTIMNLVINGAESITGKGVITITTRNQRLTEPLKGYKEIEEGNYAVLSVSDTGAGISLANLNKIFEPFFTKKEMGRSGTGLGLAVVWGTVEDHNGYIDVQSVEGSGTTFTIYLPATKTDLPVTSPTVTLEEYMGNGDSILVVDDTESQRKIASEIFQKLGYKVDTVASGEDAIQYLQKKPIDLLILDMIMAPGIDGLETYLRSLQLNPTQKAIITSGFSETTRVKKALKAGAATYIRKPYTMEKIGLAVKKVLTQ